MPVRFGQMSNRLCPTGKGAPKIAPCNSKGRNNPNERTAGLNNPIVVSTKSVLGEIRLKANCNFAWATASSRNPYWIGFNPCANRLARMPQNTVKNHQTAMEAKAAVADWLKSVENHIANAIQNPP